jgi:hypothetical protein
LRPLPHQHASFDFRLAGVITDTGPV